MEALSAVGENANEDEVCDEFGDEGDLTTSLEMVTSDLETVGYEINTWIFHALSEHNSEVFHFSVETF